MSEYYKFHTQIHTVFLIAGSSNCGKSFWAEHTLIPELDKISNNLSLKLNTSYLSLDDVKLWALGINDDYNKQNTRMKEIDKIANNILKNTLENILSFPSNPHFVVVDANGLSADFRTDINNIVKKHNYNMEIIVFNHVDEKPLLDEVKQIHYINSMTLCDFKITNIDEYHRCILDPKKQYVIIGDVHECIYELQDLIRSCGFIIEDHIIKTTPSTENMVIILVGDFIDKSNKTKEIIHFIHKNIYTHNLLKIVLGNHEKHVKNMLHYEKLAIEIGDVNMKKYFSGYLVLKDDTELANKLYDIINYAVPFFSFESPDEKSKSFYVTHALCENKYIGKLDDVSKEKQNFCIFNMLNINEWLQEQIDTNSKDYPYHVMGHIAINNPYLGYAKNNNLLLIDTGCASGNKLTGILLGNGIIIPRCQSVNYKFTDGQTILQQKLQTVV